MAEKAKAATCTSHNFSKMHPVFPDTKPSEKLSDLITIKMFGSDMARLSPLHQTSSLESFHM